MIVDTSFNHSVTEIFERQVWVTPENIAVFDQHRSLTYRQLNEKSNQLAHWIHQQGIMPGDFVALLLEPSVEFIVCILAIIKAGGAYLPLDILAPKKRLQTILNDAMPRIVITNGTTCLDETEHRSVFLIKNLQEMAAQLPTQNLTHTQAPGDPRLDCASYARIVTQYLAMLQRVREHRTPHAVARCRGNNDR